MERSLLLKHYFSGFDNDFDGVTFFQRKFFRAAARDNAFDVIFSYFHHNVGHNFAQFHFQNFSFDLITC